MVIARWCPLVTSRGATSFSFRGGNFGTRKAEVLNSLIINTTAKANDTTDILQTIQLTSCKANVCKMSVVSFALAVVFIIRGGNFHEISLDDVIVLFNRGTTFSQTVTYSNYVFCPQARSP